MRPVAAGLVALLCGGAAGVSGAQEVLVSSGADFALDLSSEGQRVGAAASLYLRAERRGWYGAAWLDLDSRSADSAVELDLGYEHEFPGGAWMDAGYARYCYPGDGGNCCGDLYLELGAPLGRRVEVSAKLYHDPETSLSALDTDLDILATDRLTVSAFLNHLDLDEAETVRDWGLELEIDLGRDRTLELSWTDASDADRGTLGIGLSWGSDESQR